MVVGYQVVRNGLIKISAKNRHSIFPKCAIGPQYISNRVVFDFLDEFVGHFAGSERAGDEQENAGRTISPRKEIQAGVLRYR